MIDGAMRTAFVLALAIGALTREMPAQVPAAVKVTAQARAIQAGELVVLTIVTANPVESVRVRGFDRDIPSYREGPLTWRTLIGIDLEVTPGRHTISISAGPAKSGQVTQTLVVLSKKFTTRKLTVDDAFVNPPAEVMPRIQADTELLNRAWAAPSVERLWNGAFVRPVADAANSAFGSRSVFNGVSRNPHSGADFSSPAGTAIHAPNSGRVVIAKDLYFSGNTIVIDHGLGLFSLFAHLQTMDVQVGAAVSSGDVLGKVGATGRVTGPHLHWAVRLNGARVDPLSLLAVLGKPGKAPGLIISSQVRH